MPACIGRLLTLVQFLIGYGKHRAAAMRPALMPRLRLTMQARFGTSGLARILFHIARSLQHPAAPNLRQPRLVSVGQGASTSSERGPVQPNPFVCRSITTAVGRAAWCGAVPVNLDDDDDLPGKDQIAAMIRRVRAGGVVTEICHTLRPAPATVSPQPWSDLHHATIMFGGNIAKRSHDIMLRIHTHLTVTLDANPSRSGAELRDLRGSICEHPATA